MYPHKPDPCPRNIASRLAAVLFGTAFVLAACQATTGESDKLTWDRGFVHIPGSGGKCSLRMIGFEDAREDCLAPQPNGTSGLLPVVLFLHGCGGINQRQYHVMELFTNLGYVTFMPDSFARPNRWKACGATRQIQHLRFAEIAHALSEFKKIPWIDQSRLVLAGFSEGGVIAGRYSGSEFKARVVLGWGCVGGGLTGEGPLLNLVGKRDFATPGDNRLCPIGSSWKNSLARHVNAGHNVADDPETGRIIKDFLDQVL